MELRFENAWVLYLLWLVPSLTAWWYFINRRSEEALARFVSLEMQSKLMPRHSRARFKWQLSLISAALLLMLIACARPQWGVREEKIFSKGRDLIVALDVSRSMLAKDVHPSRLERAKIDIMDLLKTLEGDRAGLLAFRYKGILLCPLTTDYSYLRQMLDSANVNSAPFGETDIGDAILKSIDAFNSQDASSKAIILISDGEDMTGNALDAAKEAAKKKIPIFTVGIGSPRGAKIPEPEKSGFVQYDGKDVETRLNNETLRKIAEITGGAYIPIQTSGITSMTLGNMYNDYLSKIAESEATEKLHRSYIDRYQWFLLPAVMLLLASAFFSRGRLATGKAAKPIASLLFIGTLLMPLNSEAQTNGVAEPALEESSAGDMAREAQDLYLQGRFEDAANAYVKASQTADQSARFDYMFNAAAAYNKAGKHSEASALLEQISGTNKQRQPEVSAALGTAYYRQAESIEGSSSTNLMQKEEYLRKSGNAFAEAVKGKPDKAYQQNLSAILGKIPETAEQAKIARLMEKYGTSQSFNIVDEMLSSQRTINDELTSAYSNSTPERVALLEKISDKQKENSDLWIPLKSKLFTELATQNQTNQQQNANINQLMEYGRDSMVTAASKVRDIDPEGYSRSAASEPVVYNFWKGVAPFEPLLREDLRRQSNSIDITSNKTRFEKDIKKLKEEQAESASLTQLFTERFKQQVPESGTAPAPQAGSNTDTNGQKGITAEDRKKVLELAEKVLNHQKSALTAIDKNDANTAEQEEKNARSSMFEIQKLLPKQQNQQQQENQQQKQDQQQKNDKKQDNQQKQEKQDQKKNEVKNEVPDDIRTILNKALEREKEHEEEKKKRERTAQPVVDRDW